MWDQWKKKIKELFNSDSADEVHEHIETSNTGNDHKEPLHTKVTYQYPNKKSFRFPVIPDQVKETNTIEKPAFERKRNEKYEKKQVSHYKKNRTESSRDKRNREKQITTGNAQSSNQQQSNEKHTIEKTPFQPTQVASPIYGYNLRKKDKEVENVPAFVRKQHSEEPLLSEVKQSNDIEIEDAIQEEEIVDSNVLISEEIHEKPPVQETEHTTAEEHSNEPIKQEPINLINDQNDSKGKDEDSVKREHGKEERNRNQNNRRSQHNQHKKTTNNKHESVLPFNVMMSANDKRKLQERTQKQKHFSQTVAKRTIPFHLLNDPNTSNNEDRLWITNQQELLEKTLKYFNVRASVVNATQGPSVTRFEVQPELGVKVSKVKNLSDDLKLNMAAKDIRIEAPIPGKNTIGIEIPNPHSQMVGLQEIFSTDKFKNSPSPLTIGLGLNIEGEPLITNIQKMPHGLIAGATGSGKSVCINTILVSLLYKANHDEVKFMLIDPKMVELAPYNNIPHLVSPVITDVKAATVALKWAVSEMEDRYEKFVQEGVRDVERYNQKMKKQNRNDERLPFLVIVIDELADLMMVSPQDVEDAICRIAQKARACGIHLLVATQRPSVDVITGLIKSNIPTRIAFSVSSQVDSRTIIDTSGAEKLLGKGDMLFVENGAGKSVRLQGAFVSDEEIERVTRYARSIAPPNYLFEQDQLLEQLAVEDDDADELLENAIEFVVGQSSASTSLLQRHYKIGYNRAARLMDTMESKGVIAPQNGSKPREVLITKSQLDGMKE